jgi:hypothetical protein
MKEIAMGWREVLSWEVSPEGITPELIAKEKLVNARVVQALRAKGLYVQKDDSGDVIFLNLGEEPTNEPRFLFSVTPRIHWPEYVERNHEIHGDWAHLADAGCEKFMTVMERFHFEQGSAGGHPLNTDYSSPSGLSFFGWWGNPYHV